MSVGTQRTLGGSKILRIVIVVALMLFAVPPAAEQQTGKVYRIGFLRAGPPPREWVEAFQQRLRER